MVARAVLEDMHRNMVEEIAAHGGKIGAIFYCPHTPEEHCSCRKPEPGLILQARDAYELDVSKACMIGDNLKDIQCAQRAGCGKAILVRTGHGRQTEEICQHNADAPDHVADDLKGAVKWLLKGPGPHLGC